MRRTLLGVTLLAALAPSAPAASAAAASAATVPPAIRDAGAPAVRAWRSLADAFPALVAPVSTGSVERRHPGERVLGYPADNIARVATPRGAKLVISTRPLRTLAPDGSSAPVDLSLTQTAAGRIAPRNAPFALSIAATAAGGFAIGPRQQSQITVTPLGADPAAAVVQAAGGLVAPATHPGVDTVLRPTGSGLETFEQIRDPAATEEFAYDLDLAAGQVLAERGGVATVTQDGRTVLRVTAPTARDADGTPVPIALTANGHDLVVTVRHHGGGFTYPIAADPEWESAYDWSRQAGIGTEGWFVDPSTDVPFYNTDILTDPIPPDPRDPTGFNPNVGIRITPKNGQLFPPNAGAQLTWAAPGTTRIAAVDYRDLIERNDRDRQSLRLRLLGGSGPPPTDDYFVASETALVRDSVVLESPGADAKQATIVMFTPPCTPDELDQTPPLCPRFVPVGHTSILKVGGVDISLLDDDFPVATASGALKDLADRWTQGAGPLGVDLDLTDPGAGIDAWALRSTDSAGDHEIQSSPPLCDPTHNSPGQGSNICPFHTTQAGMSIDLSGLPEGQNRFNASATDYAGNSSDDGATSDVWSVYIDRTKPTIQASGPLHDARDTWVDPAEISAKVRLDAHDDRSGVEHTDLSATDDTGAQVAHTTSDACPTPGPPGQPCPNDYPDEVTLDAGTIPEGTLRFSATATDHVDLVSDPATWRVHLDRTPPIGRARGELVALQDQWTNAAGQANATLDGRDALSGVVKLDLLAVNDDGRRVIGSVDTCAPADHDPGDGSCPHLTTKTLAVDVADLPDGQNHFEVRAHDLAGHVSRITDSWDTYIDHTAPPTPTGIAVTSNTPDTANIRWNPVVDVPEGAQGVSYQYLVLNAGTPVTQWTSTPYPSAIVSGLSPGVQYTILVNAVDEAGNVSPSGHGSGLLAFAAASTSGAAGLPFVQKYAPFIYQDVVDGFYPVSFRWVPRLRNDDNKGPCVHDGDRCRGAVTIPLRSTEGDGRYLEYPAQNDRDQQAHLIDRTLRVAGYPENAGLGRQALARMAYYLVGGADADGSFVIQYWYFFTYNFFDGSLPFGIHVVDLDKHEGDLEHVDIRFSPTGVPRRITLSRHATDQYGHYGWNEVDKVGTHPQVYAAHGDHGLYRDCGRHQLYLHDGPLPAADHTCDHGGAVTSAVPESVTTRLNNLNQQWACWQGKLGNKGPGAPIRQSTIRGASTLCANAERAQTRARPRQAPSPLASAAQAPVPPVEAVDDALKCGSYERPPDGVYGVVAVACDQAQLTASGATAEANPAIRWLDSSSGAQLGDPGPPAVVRSDDPSRLEHLQLAAASGSAPAIYLARVGRDGVFSHASFAPTHLAAGERLLVEAPETGPWRLVTPTGRVIAQTGPEQAKIPAELAPPGPPAPLPRGLRLRRGKRTSTLSWRILRPANVAFNVLASRTKGTTSVTAVARLSARRGTRFHVTLRNAQIAGRFIRVLAVRGDRSRRSAAIRVARP
jgi:hypothetical protein